jgi:hypothetical protein
MTSPLGFGRYILIQAAGSRPDRKGKRTSKSVTAVAFDAILQHEEEDDYWMFLQLAERLDSALALRLAKRASAHSDSDIRELGEEYVQKWNGHGVRKHIADNAS